MNRHLTIHDLTWFLELARNKQLDLDPPYQRRSVWTRKDRQYFLDTIFRNYPSPAIFLHKSVDENGRPTYHVVDGKQRIQTVIMFVENKLRIGDDFGDVRLSSRKWSDMKADTDLKNTFWNYKFVVEELGFENSSVVNDVFERINRNSRKLTRQELRHAKYDGWFIKKVEQEAEDPVWRHLGVVTQGREKRMNDSQFISELMLVVLENKIRGFNQDDLDDAYAEFDDISHEESTVNEDDFSSIFSNTKQSLLEIEKNDKLITTNFRSLAAIYTIWSVLVLEGNLRPIAEVIGILKQLATALNSVDANLPLHSEAQRFAENLRGASTDLSPRTARYEVLATLLRNPNP